MLCKPEYHADIEGDLLQLYYRRVRQNGKRTADFMLLKDIIQLIRPGLLRNFTPSGPNNTTAMLKHNFVLSLRNLQRDKTSGIINLVGLSTALVCVILIGVWVSDELAVDKFHEKDKRLFQIMNNLQSQDVLTIDLTPAPLAAALAHERPEVEFAVFINDFFSWQTRQGILSVGDKYAQASGWHSSADFFQVFSFDLVEGDRNKMLRDKNNIVISTEVAYKLFSDPNEAMGKTIQWEHPLFDGLFIVSGVFELPAAPSTAKFDFLITMDVLLEHERWAKQWTQLYGQTYVVLKEGVDPDKFSADISGFLKPKGANLDKFTLFAQQYSTRYLHDHYENGVATGGRIVNVKLFSLLAALILLIACVNFMNLSTARASLKMKEIGVKKTLGARRRTLVGRFFSESFLVTFISTLVAIPVAILLIPEFNTITGKSLRLEPTLWSITAAGGIVLLTAMVAGSYPAFYLARFNPVVVLKGRVKLSHVSLITRKGLVTFQFMISVLFIVGLMIVNRQINFIQAKDLGYDRDHVLIFQWKGELYDMWSGLGDDGKTNKKFESFLAGLGNLPGVLQVTNMSGNILNRIYGQSGITWTGDESERDYIFQSPIIGFNFIETLGIELKEGRSFSKERRDDYSKVILNESAVALMGLQNPVGQKIKMDGGNEVVGVVKDFHYGSLHDPIRPMIFRCDPNGRTVMVRIQPGAEQQAIQEIEKYYTGYLPNYTFDYKFMGDEYNALYASENKIASLSQYFSFVAIIISCLGLFGLAAFTTERRMKEISIRKILGSTRIEIVRLLTLEFARPIMIAIVIALPMSYFLAQAWLNGFAERIELNWTYFAIAAIVLLIIAWLTIALQTVKAARVNIVRALKED